MPALQDLDAIIGGYSGLSRRVLDYTRTMKELVVASKQPGFDPAAWDAIAACIDTDVFERVGNFKEVMNWPTYRAFLEGWARGSDWDCSFKRVTEQGNLVLLELEERSSIGGVSNTVNSVSVYEFDAAGQIRHLDIYLQMPLPDPAMLASYADVNIAG